MMARFQRFLGWLNGWFARRQREEIDQRLKRISVEDLAYAAGILDRGMIGITKVSDERYADGFYYREYLSVSNTDRELLDWMQARFGGSVSGPTQPAGKNAKPVFHWKLNHSKVRTALFLLSPHLRIKRRQAEVCLSIAERVRYGRRRSPNGRFGRGWQRDRKWAEQLESAYQELRSLNKRGVA